MLEKAMRLCEAAFGFLSTYDGEHFHAVALRSVPEKYVAEFLSSPYRPGPGTTHDRLLRGERLVHIPDLARDGVDNPRRQAVIDLLGVRTILAVPLLKDSALLGILHFYRKEVRPFSDKQIALLQNFAAQAVIAMEERAAHHRNARGIGAADRDRRGIAGHQFLAGDLAPVFDAILGKAHRLCGAALGSLGIFDGETWRAVVQRGYGEPLASKLRQGGPGSDNPLLQELIDGAPLVHVADLAQLDLPIARANVAAGVASSM
jgi:hypothetical protein